MTAAGIIVRCARLNLTPGMGDFFEVELDDGSIYHTAKVDRYEWAKECKGKRVAISYMMPQHSNKKFFWKIEVIRDNA